MTIDGAAYRVKAEHPRRPGQPLRVTAADGTVLAECGQTCAHVTDQALLASMIANGYLEPVAADEPRRNKPAKGKTAPVPTVPQPPAVVDDQPDEEPG